MPHGSECEGLATDKIYSTGILLSRDRKVGGGYIKFARLKLSKFRYEIFQLNKRSEYGRINSIFLGGE